MEHFAKLLETILCCPSREEDACGEFAADLNIYFLIFSRLFLKDNNQIKDGTSPHWRRDSVGSKR